MEKKKFLLGIKYRVKPYNRFIDEQVFRLNVISGFLFLSLSPLYAIQLLLTSKYIILH